MSKLHFIQEVTETRRINVVKISTLDNPPDVFTKVLPINKLHYYLNLIKLKAETEEKP